ncbi:hypothetical protein B0H17DRAFT_1193274 [Mycena rosella]|uniref:Uncharacterized protein n=1 Tax=Mycena rosella TaxID=1033263 RepID=A0AAD7GTB6_MYCRO|nr:hypothetical protein B0H17DRAFT_1193274 [Mycena rosella]
MAIISLQETQHLFGAAIRPADDTNVRHHAIMRKALETYPVQELQATFERLTRLRVSMGTSLTFSQFGKIQSNYVYAQRHPEVRQALRAYCEAYGAYFKQRGNEYAVCDPQALIQLQVAEQTWHDWAVGYRASRGMPGHPYWALEPLPGLQHMQLQLQPAMAPVPPATPRRRAGRSFFPLPTPPPSSPVCPSRPSSPVRPSRPSSPVRPSRPTPAPLGSQLCPIHVSDAEALRPSNKRKRPPSQINLLGVIDISDDDEEASHPCKKVRSLGVIDLTD